MTKGGQFWMAAVAAAAALTLMAGEGRAAACGSSAAGFDAWKKQFGDESRGRFGGTAIAALMSTSYSNAAIAADRGQRSFGLSLEQFMAKRGASAIVSRGRGLKNSAMFASIQQRYGVPPGPLIAIWGMETGFGSQHGNQHALSAVATLAYDCRRTAFFTDQLNAFLTLIDRGVLSPNARGSMAGEQPRDRPADRARPALTTTSPGDHRRAAAHPLGTQRPLNVDPHSG